MTSRREGLKRLIAKSIEVLAVILMVTISVLIVWFCDYVWNPKTLLWSLAYWAGIFLVVLAGGIEVYLDHIKPKNQFLVKYGFGKFIKIT
ncbi:MAG: hypothetical protein KA007_03465 [Candidatus Pacebacteria bacterium]|nr:hypothetical protein [Candidatus Paceibacterota bacterium]